MRTSGLLLLSLGAVPLLLFGNPPADSAPDREALTRLQDFIGQWRGVGQPRRGSTRGARRETSGWAWQLSKEKAAFVFESDGAKYFRRGMLQWKESAGVYELTAETGDGRSIRYAGTIDEHDRLVLMTSTPKEGLPARVSIRLVAEGKRLVVLYEKRSPGDRYLRLAEVGYTRKGSGFGKGTTYVECVVTGGLGTIPVTHDGKTYYVCCGGCRDYFNEDPEAVLADYRRKKAEAKGPKCGTGFASGL